MTVRNAPRVETGTQDEPPSYLLQEDGESRFLLEDGSGFIILERFEVGGPWVIRPDQTDGPWIIREDAM